MKRITIYIGSNPQEPPTADKVECVRLRQMVRSDEAGWPAMISDGGMKNYEPVPVSAYIVCHDGNIPAAVREMEADGIAYASCAQCEIFNVCKKADWDDYSCRACCRSADICEVYDCEQPHPVRTAEFVLLDKTLLNSEDVLLARLKKYFPELSDMQVPLFLPSPTSVLPN